MSKELEEIKRHNRRIWVVLTILVLLTLAGLLLNYLHKPAPVVKNYVGRAGNSGLSIQGPRGYDGIQGIQGAQGIQGVEGKPGPEGPQGIQGPAGPQGNQGPVGETGATGQDGKEVEFRCAPNGNYQWRYVGDEAWQNIQKNSKACQGTP